MKHVYRKAKRSREETARLRAERERYQREKPSPEQLLAEGGHADFVPLGLAAWLGPQPGETSAAAKQGHTAHGATLVTRNLRYFRRVPRLRLTI
jgi:hypothetical protein